jgi:hypothetical protein
MPPELLCFVHNEEEAWNQDAVKIVVIERGIG